MKGIGMIGRAIGGFGKTTGGIAGGVLRGKYGTSAAGAAYGALSGGAYGAMSNNTSVVGGMTGGALLGAGAARYGGAGMRGMNRLARSTVRAGTPRAPISQYARRGGAAMLGRMKGDALLASNRARNSIKGLRGRSGL